MENAPMRLSNKFRWKELTYKLIYPAFFGNMVYDFITFINDHEGMHWTLIAATAFVLLFYILDYVHLNVDLENLVPEEKKGKVYMFADIGVTLALFLAVAFVKFHLPEIVIFLVCLVPILFAWYNSKLGYHTKFHKCFRGASILLIVGFAGLYLFIKDSSYYPTIRNCYLLAVSFGITTTYLIYNLKNFWLPDKPNI